MLKELTSIPNIVRALDEFNRVNRQSVKKKSLTQLAVIAAALLRLDKVPAKSTISCWKKLENEYRRQALKNRANIIVGENQKLTRPSYI